jgi:hypothetical protein
VPEIVGAVETLDDVDPLDDCFTWIENGSSDALDERSLTTISMFESVPTLAAEGVPLSVPLEALNVAQAGLLVMLKWSDSELAPDVVGVKL